MASFKNVEVEPFIAGLHEYLARAFRPLVDRVKVLERDNERLRELEARVAHVEERGIEYLGIHQRACDYKRGSVVTHGGSMWVCVRATSAIPGTSGDWQLAVKGGGV